MSPFVQLCRHGLGGRRLLHRGLHIRGSRRQLDGRGVSAWYRWLPKAVNGCPWPMVVSWNVWVPPNHACLGTPKSCMFFGCRFFFFGFSIINYPYWGMYPHLRKPPIWQSQEPYNQRKSSSQTSNLRTNFAGKRARRNAVIFCVNVLCQHKISQLVCQFPDILLYHLPNRIVVRKYDIVSS